MNNIVGTDLKIGVVAGTPVDTALGVSYIQERGIIAYGEPIANSPKEQTLLQQLHLDELHKRVNSATDKLKERNVDSVIVYCNSLSVCIDIEYFRGLADIPIITPLDIYRDIALQYSVFGLIAANCNSCAGIERAILERNEDARVIGYGDLRIVNDIEKGISPWDIIVSHSILDIFHLMEKDGAQIIILGCTHFTRIRKELIHTTDVFIPILEPSLNMLEKAINMISV